MTAWLNLRHRHDNRYHVFTEGLKAIGYKVKDGLTLTPKPDDLLITWNRIGIGNKAARAFEDAGATVIVAENASWGNTFAGSQWYHLSLNYHNRADCFPIGGSERWDSLNIQLMPWRTSGETVVLLQRGIGPPGIAQPREWGYQFKARTRGHPGKRQSISLDVDLANCGKVITWGSGAAIKALMWGIHVESHMPKWIGQQDNTDEGRLAMFQRLAWAQWTLSEIAEGTPFKRLIEWKS